jgi:hypothetical protein
VAAKANSLIANCHNGYSVRHPKSRYVTGVISFLTIFPTRCNR